MERAELKAWVRNTVPTVVRGEMVFLCDPHWSARERADAEAQFDLAPENVAQGWLAVRTGGSGGGVKFARHDEETLGAAVRGFCRHFGFDRVNAVGVLPLYHVSGLLGALRCAMTGGEYIASNWPQLEAGELPKMATREPWVISLVPTQLQRLLQQPRAVEWLRGFAGVFLGGGPVWPQLADAAAAARIPVSLSYGMTETAAMIAAQRPAEFLAGRRDAGTALPHANVSVDADGILIVRGASVFRGYHPSASTAREFVTEDLGRIDADGRVQVLGRRDALIITGGKKVDPAAVEAALRASGEFVDVALIGVPDSEWGEAVVALYAAGIKRPDLERAVAALPGHERPKRFVALASWPRNAQGKINRALLRQAALDA